MTALPETAGSNRDQEPHRPKGEELRASRGTYERRVLKAYTKAAKNTEESLLHCRVLICCLLGLSGLRCVAWFLGQRPSLPAFTMNAFSALTDLLDCICCGSVAFSGVQGCCVQRACLGPMLSLVFSMLMLDLFSLLTFVYFVAPQPVASGPGSLLDVAEAATPAWDCILFASSALELALCVSVWRIYQGMRLAGNYPPDNPRFKRGMRPKNISPLEIFCEEEDIELLSSCDRGCGTSEAPPEGSESWTGCGRVGSLPNSDVDAPEVPLAAEHEIRVGNARQPRWQQGGAVAAESDPMR